MKEKVEVLAKSICLSNSIFSPDFTGNEFGYRICLGQKDKTGKIYRNEHVNVFCTKTKKSPFLNENGGFYTENILENLVKTQIVYEGKKFHIL